MNEFYSSGFAPAPIKNEGDISNPDAMTWECDLNQCQECRAKYDKWKQRYIEQEQQYAAVRSKEDV